MKNQWKKRNEAEMNGKERRLVNDSSESICNDRERER